MVASVCKFCKPNLPNQTCQTKPTKLNLPNQTYQTKLTKPNLPYQTYETKYTKPNLRNQAYQTKLTKPNQTYLTKPTKLSHAYQTKPTNSNQIKMSLPSILNQTHQAKIIGQSSQRLGPWCLWQCLFLCILFIFYNITQGLESTIVCKKRAAWRRVVGCEPGIGGGEAACFDSISPLLLLQFTLLLLLSFYCTSTVLSKLSSTSTSDHFYCLQLH